MPENTTAVQPWLLKDGDQFTVEQYRYVTFSFGTDWGYRRQYGDKLGPKGIPWANRNAAVIASKELQARIPKPVIAAHVSLGDLVEVPEYGIYRIERDHNANVKFVLVTPELGSLTPQEQATLLDIVKRYHTGAATPNVAMSWVFGLVANSALGKEALS